MPVEVYVEATGKRAFAGAVDWPGWCRSGRDEETALDIAHDQWRTNVFSPPVPWDLDSVALFDEAAKHVPREAVRESVLVSADPKQHVQWLQDLVELGFDEIYLHHVGQEQREWLEVFGAHVLPELAA